MPADNWDTPRQRRLLIISNGHGEDAIAAALVRRLPSQIDCSAYPTLGAGHAYSGVCRLVGPRRHLPSQGLKRRGSFWRDAGAGFGVRQALAFMRDIIRTTDAVVVVGDVLGVLMTWLVGGRVALYLDVYKSGYAERYSAAERWLIGRTCARVFTADAILAEQLTRAGIAAECHGNAMMDTLTSGQFDCRAARRHPAAVLILPGSRKETADNFSLQWRALSAACDPALVDIFLALAPGIEPSALAAASGLSVVAGSGNPGDGGMLVGDGAHVQLVTGGLGGAIAAADVVLGQAGTANLQAIGCGRPVVSFLAEGARPSRRRRIAALTGDSRIVVPRNVDALAIAVRSLLNNPADRERRGAIGRERIGSGGALDAASHYLADLLDAKLAK